MNKKIISSIFILIIFITLFACNNNDEKSVATPTKINGEDLFMSNCSSCHRVDTDLTGPALKGARKRWADTALLYEFIKDPASVILKDKYAAALQNKYPGLMTPFPALSKEEVDAILDYCDK